SGASGLSTTELHRAHVLLHLHRPDRGLPEPPKVALTRAPAPPPSIASTRPVPLRARPPQTEGEPPPEFTPSEDDIAEARLLIAELNEKIAPALARRRAVCDEIVRGCEARELAAFYLDASTGGL